jgi:hypothetical protein
MDSIVIAPPKMNPSDRNVRVIVGIRAFGTTWSHSTFLSRTPFARAVWTKSSFMTSISVPHDERVLPEVRHREHEPRQEHVVEHVGDVGPAGEVGSGRLVATGREDRGEWPDPPANAISIRIPNRTPAWRRRTA